MARRQLASASRGTEILFGQKGVSATFSKKGTFKGASIDEVAEKLKSGALAPDDVLVKFITYNGERVVVNNRSLAALTKAGKRPTKTLDVTGKLSHDPLDPDNEDAVMARLAEMGNKPSESIVVRSTNARDSPPKETVTLEKGKK